MASAASESLALLSEERASRLLLSTAATGPSGLQAVPSEHIGGGETNPEAHSLGPEWPGIRHLCGGECEESLAPRSQGNAYSSPSLPGLLLGAQIKKSCSCAQHPLQPSTQVLSLVSPILTTSSLAPHFLPQVLSIACQNPLLLSSAPSGFWKWNFFLHCSHGLDLLRP